MKSLLSQIDSPHDLQSLSIDELDALAGEMRTALCELVSNRTAHFASNLGVVELCLALHTTFDFSRDRLIWDTGHQIYPHKMITGRFHEFGTMRTKGGLMGYPNPKESDYDLFMTGHAGSSVSTALGLKAGDDLIPGNEDRHSVAVIGDGAFPSGIVFEALNNAAELKKRFLIVLNDNKMSICPRVGGVAAYLDRLRVNPMYTGLKTEVQKMLHNLPVLGDPVERWLLHAKASVKAGLLGGMLFEELGIRYIGPVDGHNIAHLRKYLEMVKDVDGPVLLHVVTEKGHGFKPAAEDPVFFHTPPRFEHEDECVISIKKSSTQAYTDVASGAIHEQMQANDRVTVMTAAMCQGTKLETIREEIPDRFFDTGICESHAVAFAAGQAKVGLRPIVDIYSTFLQRSFDQIFQEVALQNLPVTFMLDRAGLTGPDGATHHGMFDFAYMRVFPNMVVMAPGDAADFPLMLDFALSHDSPCSMRYPKAASETIQREVAAIELGQAEVIRQGPDGTLVACGTLLTNCVAAAEKLSRQGVNLTVVNARFVKPLDTGTLFPLIENSPFVLTVEEGARMGGFGSALTEAAVEAGLDTRGMKCLGIPDRFIEHGERGELLTDLGLDVDGIAKTAREMAKRSLSLKGTEHRQVS